MVGQQITKGITRRSSQLIIDLDESGRRIRVVHKLLGTL